MEVYILKFTKPAIYILKACHYNQTSIALLLIEAKASLDLQDNNNQTALHTGNSSKLIT